MLEAAPASGLRASSAPVRLSRKRVYILPTRHGLAYALALFVMLLGSVNYDNGLGYMLTFLLGGLALVSILHTYKNLAGLSVRAGKAPAVFAGSEGRFTVCLDNTEQPTRHAVWIRHPRQLPLADARAAAAVTTVVPAGRVHRAPLPVTMSRRGWLPLGRIVIASRYPFGLFRAWSNVELGVGCLVYPRPAGRFELPLGGASETRDGGRDGRGRDDFSGFREYLPGDSPRQIFWKAAAREQGMPVKLFAGASAAEVQLRWQDAAEGDVEQRLSQLCRWVVEADRQGYRYGLQIPGVAIAPAAGASHRRRCLEALALYPGAAGGPPPDARAAGQEAAGD